MPDLLFDDVREERLEDIRSLLDSPQAIDANAPLHRVTVFLTYRCNLACPYCKTIARTKEELRERPQKGVTFAFEDFEAMFLSHAGTPIRHLHFTGGEAALIRELPRMIRLAKERGTECVSITSNGTLPPATYLAMLDAGIDEIRISLDAADPAL
ncbi:MAG TPA: radical SAM protein, partial [Planctomycetota bacterium]|nr:radical SAM protein [Planctomycetota bacterium]